MLKMLKMLKNLHMNTQYYAIYFHYVLQQARTSLNYIIFMFVAILYSSDAAADAAAGAAAGVAAGAADAADAVEDTV